MGSRSARMLEAIGRYDGDEFVALLPEVADESACFERAAHRAGTDRRRSIVGAECSVTASVGIVPLPARDGASVTDLTRPTWRCITRRRWPNSGTLPLARRCWRAGRRSRAQSAPYRDRARRTGAALPAQGPMREVSMVGVEALMRWRRNGVLVPPAEIILWLKRRAPSPLSQSGPSAMGGSARRGCGRRLAPSRSGQPAELAVRARRPGRVHPTGPNVTRSGVPHRAIEIDRDRVDGSLRPGSTRWRDLEAGLVALRT